MATRTQFQKAHGVSLHDGGFLTEYAVDGLVAFAGGGQSSATPLTGQLNRVVTVATAGDSVLLPTNALVTAWADGPRGRDGLAIVVRNDGANALAVFPEGSDAIDGGSASASVSLPAGTIATFYCFTAGAWFTSLKEALGAVASLSVSTLLAVGGALTLSAANALTAHAGGGQASALALTANVNRVTTVATAADSVKLIPATVGAVQIVFNKAASNALQVFGAGTDTINGVATGTGVSLTAGKGALYACAVAGAWDQILTA